MADLDPAVRAHLDKLLEKDQNELTDHDKAFLRARESYLTKAQKDEYSDALAAPKKGDEVPVPGDEEGGKQVTPASVAAEIIGGRSLDEVPTKQLNKIAVIYGIPEEPKRDRQQLIDAIRTKLGPTADQNPQ